MPIRRRARPLVDPRGVAPPAAAVEAMRVQVLIEKWSGKKNERDDEWGFDFHRILIHAYRFLSS